jgi:hypothetical protein
MAPRGLSHAGSWRCRSRGRGGERDAPPGGGGRPTAGPRGTNGLAAPWVEARHASLAKTVPATAPPPATCPYPRCVGPFLKEFVKRKRFPSGFLRNGSAWRNRLFCWFVGRDKSCVVSVVAFRDSSRLSSPREVAIVLFRGDCSQHIPSRGTAHDNREQLCLVIGRGRCGFIWCEFLTVWATPSKASCGLASTILAEAAASTVRLELAQTGGISSCMATQIEQPGRFLVPYVSSLFCSGRTSTIRRLQ